VVVPLNQQDVGAKPPSRNGGRRSGRTTADHQHVGFGKNWNFPRGLENRFAGADAPHAITATKQLKTLGGADAAAVITAAWGVAENLALPRRSYTGFGLFVGCHFKPQPLGPWETVKIVINDSRCSTPVRVYRQSKVGFLWQGPEEVAKSRRAPLLLDGL
jgi:hypothetical protein